MRCCSCAATHPVTALTAATVLYLLASATQGDSNAPLAVPLFAYSVGLTRPVRVSATIVGLAALALSTATFYGPGDPDALIIVVWFLLFGVGWAVAVSIRRNQDRTEQLSQAVDDLEASQAQLTAAAIAQERARIARELHDAVGHAVNVMVLQAGAARLSNRPDAAFVALREIENLGRSALTDLDHMLGLLDDTDAPVLGPAKTSRRHRHHGRTSSRRPAPTSPSTTTARPRSADTSGPRPTGSSRRP